MRTTEIKQQLHNYIDTVEDKKLKAIYTLLEADMYHISQLSDSQKIELDKRMAEHENGIGRTFTWDETIGIARGSLK
jgi:putative addiction module component (TIGR02574 family)